MMITVHMLLYSVKNRTKLICLYHIIYIDYIFKIKQHQFLKYLLVLNMTIIKKCHFLGGGRIKCVQIHSPWLAPQTPPLMETKWFHSLAPAASVAVTDQIRGWSYWIRRRSLLVGVRAGLSHCECSGPNKSNFRYCYCMSENADVFNPFKPHVCHCINLFQLLDFARKLKSCSPTWHKVNMALEFCPGHQCT